MSDLIQKELEKQRDMAKKLSYEKKLEDVKEVYGLSSDYETENLLYTESSMDKVLDSDIEALAHYSEIKAKQRTLNFEDADIVHTGEYQRGKQAINRMSAKQTHRSMDKRKNKMAESAKRLNQVGKDARKLNEGAAGMPLQKRIKALEGLYDNVREADRYFAEAVANNKTDEIKLKEKAEINYVQNLFNLYVREEENSTDPSEKEALRQRRDKLFEKLEQMKEDYNSKYSSENTATLRLKEDDDVEDFEETKEKEKQRVIEKEAELKESISVLSGEKELKTDQEIRNAQEIKVMVCVEALRNILSTMNDKKYGTSDDMGTWFIIKSAGEAFLNNVKDKSDRQRGEDLATLLKSAQRYLGTHAGGRFTQKGRDRVDFAKSIVGAVSDILKNSTAEGRVHAVDAILKKQDEISAVGDAEAKELNKKFFADYAKDAMRKDPKVLAMHENDKKSVSRHEELITYRTFMLMHYREKNDCYGNAVRKISGNPDGTIFKRSTAINVMGKSFMLTRKGDVSPEDANDAMLAQLAIKRAQTADTKDVPYISRSVYLKGLSQIKITPEMLTEEYLDTHVYEMTIIISCITNDQNHYKDWSSGECKKVGEKEFNLLPDKLKNQAFTDFATTLREYYMRRGFLNGYNIDGHDGLHDAQIKHVISLQESAILDELNNRISDSEEREKYIQELRVGGYGVALDMYDYVDVGNGELKVMDGPKASLIKLRNIFEQNRNILEITEEDIKNIRYKSYAEEAEKESKARGITITPETVALHKVQNLVGDFGHKMLETDEGKAVKALYSDGLLEGGYLQRLRYVNYNKDGKPATKEDEENHAWNTAFAKSITENKQEDRIRLLEESFNYVADLLVRVDFDRMFDYDYWLNNKDLYVTLANFCQNGIGATDGMLQKEDIPIMEKFFAKKNPMMTLLNEFAEAFNEMTTFNGLYAIDIGLDVNNNYKGVDQNRDEEVEARNAARRDGVAQEAKERFKKIKKSLADYIVWKNNA